MTSLCAATPSGLHVLKATGERALELGGRSVDALHVDASATRWAIVDRHELWRDSGTGWEEVARSSDLRLNCVLSHGGVDVWVGAERARLLRLEDGSLVRSKSFDAAPGRNEWFTPWGGPPDVRSLATSASHVFANVHVGGILRADPGGASWEPTIEIASDVHEVVAAPDGGIAAATAWGLATSVDHGATWGFDKEGLHSSYARAVAVGDTAIFVTACDGPFGGRGAVYRRPLDAAGLTRCESGLPEWVDGNIDSGCLAASGTHVAFGTEDGSVFLSEDGGASWAEVATDLAPVRWVELLPG
jgi:hypothetical protein